MAAPARRPPISSTTRSNSCRRTRRTSSTSTRPSDILDKAGWKPGADGIREKDGVKLKIVYQTSINAPRQKNQEIVKQACQKAGIDIEIKAVPASVYFSSDVGNPDTYAKFYTDIQMYTTTMTQPDPREFMRQFLSSEVASKDNKWQGRNITRWRNADYDALYRRVGARDRSGQARRAVHPDERHGDQRHRQSSRSSTGRSVAAVSNKLHVQLSGWDSYIWNLYDWYADA